MGRHGLTRDQPGAGDKVAAEFHGANACPLARLFAQPGDQVAVGIFLGAPTAQYEDDFAAPVPIGRGLGGKDKAVAGGDCGAVEGQEFPLICFLYTSRCV